jgi:glyoxylase-like metal-dependent hydrolase (beta-lactamase superfamily II)
LITALHHQQPQFASPSSSPLPAWQWLHLPGHTPGSIGLYHPIHHLLISGDVIFNFGALGRTDFTYSDTATLHHSVRTQLLPLPENTLVLPGHEENFVLDQENKSLLTASLS